MKTIPILFSTPMVKAILEGRKTQTRRVFKEKCKPFFPHGNSFVSFDSSFGWCVKHRVSISPDKYEITQQLKCPYGEPGDILWVREKSCYVMLDHTTDLLEGFGEIRQTVYATEFHEDWMKYAKEKYGYKWTPSIHMKKSDCRLFLQVKSVRVERLQEISEQDAQAEGAPQGIYRSGPNTEHGEFQLELNNNSCFRDGFKFIWQSINGEQSWNDNPWVWVVEFERVEKPQGWPL